MKSLLLISMFLVAPGMNCQTLMLDGGTSTLFNSSGMQGTMYLPNSTVSGSIGYQHHLVFGASDTFLVHGFKTTIGDKALGFNFDGVGLGLALKGIAVERASKPKDCTKVKQPIRHLGPEGYLGNCPKTSTSLTAFVGASGVGLFAPFVSMTRPQHISSGILFQYHFGNLALSSLDVVEGGKYSAAQGGSYSTHNIKLVGSGGLLNGQKYFSGLAVLQPIRAWSLYANHQSYFALPGVVPYTAQSNGTGTNLTIGRFTAVIGLNESKSLGRKITGENVGAGIRVGFITEQSTYYKSSGNRAFLVHSVTETIRHWTLTQTINQAQDRNSYSFGGGYSHNRFSFSVSQSMQFVIGKGYQQTTGISVQLRVHDTVLHAQTITDPFGKTQYSAYLESYIQTHLQVAPNQTNNNGGGKHIFSGIVQDEQEKPVSGACLRIGNQTVYSNSQGVWEFRSRHSKPQSITVLVDEFQLGEWQVVSAPSEVQPGQLVKIVVRRKQ